MSRAFYVNGEASVACNVGAGLQELGISVDGVTIDIQEYDTGIPTDTFGDNIFGEYIYMGQSAIIKTELVYFDISILKTWLTGLPGNFTASQFGTLGTIGDLMVIGNNCSRLLIRCTPNGTGAGKNGVTGQATCYNFPFAYLLDAQETKLGTVRSIWTLTWRAVVPYQASATTGLNLFNGTCT